MAGMARVRTPNNVLNAFFGRRIDSHRRYGPFVRNRDVGIDGSGDVHRDRRRQADPQRVGAQIGGIHRNPHRNTLDNLDPIARGILGW